MPPSDDEFHERRTAALDRILDSDASLKLIVAGPGTGKTFTFGKVLEGCGGRGLAMTFLLTLVRDLQDAMGDSTDVYSFHGFARRLLHRLDGTGVSRGVTYYPPLSSIFLEDVRIVDGAILDSLALGALFRSLADDAPFLQRALASGKYYDGVGYDDAVYRVLQSLEADESRIPQYPQIVVDEFQDFCPLEVSFVKRLALRSPTLIVGDDDQALYVFRDATPQAIRDLAAGSEYDRFELPFCTRCTEVIVAATHTVVARAQRVNLLAGRLDKPYECFLPEKRADSAANPKIIHAHCSTQTSRAPYMGRYIKETIEAISDEDIQESYAKKFPAVLIIGPKPFLGQVEAHLRQSFANILISSTEAPELRDLDAYRLLVTDPTSNLGWRILVQLLQPTGWEAAVRDALANSTPLRDGLQAEFVEQHLSISQLLSHFLSGDVLTQDERAALALALGVDSSILEETITPTAPPTVAMDESKPTIMLTSLMGSKGLQAAHVFVIGMNEGHFPHQNSAPTNEEVCQLLVALTRTRKSCTIVSSGRLGAVQLRESVFVRWLAPHIKTISVNQHYFNS
ncbi:MAG TPA: UvrD-helicase domain-containing protein [Acidimicrobiales bacterium]|jgi:superfamily I DNA/RNA helicase